MTEVHAAVQARTTDGPRSYRPLGAALRESGRAYGDAPFLVSSERRLSFAELDAAVDGAASGLLRLGLARGDHVGLWLGNSVDWVIWFFACARIGAAVVPVSTRYKAEEMAYVVAHAECKALIVSEPRWGIDFYAILAELAPEIAEQRAGELKLERFPALRHLLLAGTFNTGRPGARTLISVAADPAPAEELARAERDVAVDDVLLLSYTSGTTGAPKGVMLDHRVVVQATRVGLALHMEPGDSVLGHMPLYHVAGLFMALIPSLVLGAKLVILEDWDVERALRLIEQERVSVFGGIPTHFQDLAVAPTLSNFDLSSLKSAWIGGSSVTREMFERVRDHLRIPKLLSTYGMTENTISTTFNRWDDSPETIYQNKAPILADCDVIVVDPETGAELPAEHDGEIWCRGDTVMRGYYKNSDATSEAITPEGWLRTGDIGRFDQNRYLSITGRRKEMFKTGGTNAYPAEIEQHLAKLAGVAMAAVVGVPDERLGEVGYAFVQAAQGATLTEQDVIDHCRGRIANYKVPHYVRLVDEFPRTPSGKIKKFELGKLARDDLQAGAARR